VDVDAMPCQAELRPGPKNFGYAKSAAGLAVASKSFRSDTPTNTSSQTYVFVIVLRRI